MDERQTTCGACGAVNTVSAIVCVRCGAILAAYAAPPGSVEPALSPGAGEYVVAPASLSPDSLPSVRAPGAPGEVSAPRPLSQPRRQSLAPPAPESAPPAVPTATDEDTVAALREARAALLACLRTRPMLLLALQAAADEAATPPGPTAPLPLDVLSPPTTADRRHDGGPLWQAVVAEREAQQRTLPRWQPNDTSRADRPGWSGPARLGSPSDRRNTSGVSIVAWAVIAIGGCVFAATSVGLGGRALPLLPCFLVAVVAMVVAAVRAAQQRPPR